MKRFIRVVGVVLVRDEKVLLVRRPPEETGAGFWEFPGGKIESGESPEQALVREVEEELSIHIQAGPSLGRLVHHYETTDVDLELFVCRDPGELIRLTEHDAMKWVLPEELQEDQLLAADRPFVERIRRFDLKKI